jgi:hypothetical protein
MLSGPSQPTASLLSQGGKKRGQVRVDARVRNAETFGHLPVDRELNHLTNHPSVGG